MPTNNSIIRKRTKALSKKRKFNEGEKNHSSWGGNYQAFVAYQLEKDGPKFPSAIKDRVETWIKLQKNEKTKLSPEEREKIIDDSLEFAPGVENDTWHEQRKNLRDDGGIYRGFDLARNPSICKDCDLITLISDREHADKKRRLENNHELCGMAQDGQRLADDIHETQKNDGIGTWSRLDDETKILQLIAKQKKKKSKYRLKALKSNLFDTLKDIQTTNQYHIQCSADDEAASKINQVTQKTKNTSHVQEGSMISEPGLTIDSSTHGSGTDNESELVPISDKVVKDAIKYANDQTPKTSIIQLNSRDPTESNMEDIVVDEQTSKRDCSKDDAGKSFENLETGSWGKMYNKLRLFFESRGHSTVPPTHEDQSLVQWASKQRQKASGNSYMTKKRRELLNEINFRWLIDSELYKSDLAKEARSFYSKEVNQEVAIGAVVAVYWPDDDLYYKGMVVERQNQDAEKILIKYEDGMFDWIDPKETNFVMLKHMNDPLPPRMVSVNTKYVKIGSRLSIWWPNESQYFDAVVRDVKMEEEELSFQLEYDDGEVEWSSLENRKFLLEL